MYHALSIKCANSNGGTVLHESYDMRVLPTNFSWLIKFRIMGSTGDYISNPVEVKYDASSRKLDISNITTVGVEIRGARFE